MPPSQADPEIPAWLEQITLRAMTKDRDRRYQTAEEMRQDIQRGLQGMTTEAGTMAMAAAGATSSLPPVDDRGRGDYDDYDDGYDDRREGRGGRTALWVLLGIAVVTALAFTLWLVRPDPAETMEIPDVQGMSQSEAEQSLDQRGFENVSAEEENHDEIGEGDAIGTEPAAGEERAATSDITLLISSGPGSAEIPNVVGQDRDGASQTLQEAGFEVGDTSEEASASYPEGQVVRTSPPGGQSADPGSRIDLVISSGPEQVAVPDLSEMTREEAEGALSDAGLNGDFQEESSEDVEPGRVTRQEPGGGTEVDPESSVTVWVATEPEDDEDEGEESPPETPPTTPEGDGNETPDDWQSDLPWPPDQE